MQPPFPAAILSVGTELTSGRTADTNAAFLAAEIRRLGGRVREIRVLPDDLGPTTSTLKALASQGSLLVVTGGLGPTVDDRTRDALAKAFRAPLRLHRPSLAALRTRFRRLGRPMSDNNRLQALLPAGARAIPNARGTAPGILMRRGPCLVISLPGVPHEMRGMWAAVLPEIRRTLKRPPGRTRLLHTFGLPESEVDRRIGALMREGRHPVVGLQAGKGVVTISLSAWGLSAARRIRQDEDLIRAALGEAIFGTDADTLPGTVVRHLSRRRMTLALAESATGGRVAALLTGVPGASRVLLEGRVVYTEASKRRLGVPATLLRAKSAVSAEVTRALARKARAAAGTDWGLAVTGIAGPSGGRRARPVGTFFACLQGPGVLAERRWQIQGDRETVQLRAALSCLDLLRRSLA